VDSPSTGNLRPWGARISCHRIALHPTALLRFKLTHYRNSRYRECEKRIMSPRCRLMAISCALFLWRTAARSDEPPRKSTPGRLYSAGACFRVPHDTTRTIETLRRERSITSQIRYRPKGRSSRLRGGRSRRQDDPSPLLDVRILTTARASGYNLQGGAAV
jgi:hypothetical protein